MSNLTTFVKQMLPDFVRTDHPMFETFISAYYEWMESTNTGTSSSNKDLYKELPNPIGIVNNIENYLDIDETIDGFIDFFAHEVVPTTIDNIKTDPRFFIKKTRDLYLAKGTPKSFELFFRIFFNEEIDVYETKENILKTSDGKYLSFPVAHFYVEEFGEYLNDFEFSFATLNDSDSVVAVILQGNVVDKDSVNDRNILKFIFSSDLVLDINKSYTVKDANSSYELIIKPLLSIENIRVKDPGSLYRTNDPIIFKTNTFRKNFIATISDVTNGKVDEVAIRNKGYLYKTGDLFRFNSLETDVGLGGGFSVTSVDSDGSIQSIDNKLTRTANGKGWNSNSFQSAYIPVKSGGSWAKLPKTDYKPIISVDRSVEFDDSYLQSQGYGIGAQLTPISYSIGQMNNLSFNQSPYFIDSDDVSFTVPTNIIVENIDNLFEGDIVNFRYWMENVGNYLLSDSEEIIFTNRVYSNFYYISGGPSDSEVTSSVNLSLPHDFDSDNFSWKSNQYNLKPYLADSEIWNEFDSDLNLSTLNNTRKYSFQNDYSIDGGTYNYPNILMSNVVDGNLTYLVYYNGEYFYTQEDLSSVIDVDYSSLIPLGTNTFDANSLPFEIDGDSDNVDYFTFYDSDTLAIMNDSDAILLDGGPSFDATYSLGNVDGGSSYDFSRSVYHEIEVTFKDRFVSQMEPYHIDLLDNFNTDDDFSWTFWNTDSDLLPNLAILRDTGTWQSTGHFAKVSRIDDNVVQVIPYLNYDILSDSELRIMIDDKYDLVRMEAVYPNDLSPKDEDYSPFQNIVHKIDQGSVDFDFEIVSRKDQQFWDESGFLSSASKAVLQDGYYYSDYTYNISSNVPYTEWKDSFKEMMHPAGMILTATTVVNSQVKSNANTTIGFEHSTDTQGFTFDSMLEYGEDPRPYVFGENFQTDSDNIVHKIEEFNEANGELGLGWVISSDDFYFATNAGLRQQKGDSFWDYEPLGWVSDNSTQDSDGLGKVKSEVQYYAPASDLYRQNSRYGVEFPVILRTDFNLTTDSDYDVIDSDLPVDLFVRFDDSDMSTFKSIDYNRLRTENDNKAYQLYPANRKLEIAKIKANDLNEASKENGSLVYTDKDGTYYDYDAYEKKWNQDNTRRFKHEAGWYEEGYTSYYVNNFAHEADESRRTINGYEFLSNNIITETRPYTSTAYEGGNTAWRNNYTNADEINIIEDSNNTETYRDPKVSMRGRRG